MEDGGKSFGVSLRDAPCHDDADIDKVITALAQGGGGGVLALGDVFNLVHRETITGLGLRYKIPTVVNTRQMLDAGGLISYTTDIPDPVSPRGRLRRSHSQR
jgi:putative ABC transport system substrate-binding protein